MWFCLMHISWNQRFRNERESLHIFFIYPSAFRRIHTALTNRGLPQSPEKGLVYGHTSIKEAEAGPPLPS